MKFTDTFQIAGTRIRDDGYLVVEANVARTGIQRYLGSEVGRPDLPFVDVYRSPEEVFSVDAMKSFAHIPITDDHPSEAVTADNSRDLARGWTSDEVARDGERLRVPLMVSDGAAIKKVQDGKRELSAGYSCDLLWGDGVAPDGSKYQAQQTTIRANHVAIVQRGRAGKECRIGDEEARHWGTAPITAADKETTMTLRNIMVDGLSVETTDAGAQAIEKLSTDRKALQDQLATLQADHVKALAAKDAEMAKKDAALDDANGKVLDQAAIDALVAKRSALEATALKIAKDVKPAGLSDADLKTAVVKAALGDKVPAEKLADQHYVDARFDILSEGTAAMQDTFRQTMIGGRPAHQPLGDAAVADRQKAFDELVAFDQTGLEAKVN